MAMIFPAGYAGPKEISYLFVDAGCLDAVVRDISYKYTDDQNNLTIDYRNIATSFNKIFYYSALPQRQEGESDLDYNGRNQARIARMNSIRMTDGFHVYEGMIKRGRGEERRSRQKKVDVMIAVDMLMHSFRRNMHRATLLASDIDFEPLLNALVQEGMMTTLWYPPEQTNPDLVAAADARQALTIQSMRNYLCLADGTPFWPTDIAAFPNDVRVHREVTENGNWMKLGVRPNGLHCVQFLLKNGSGGIWKHSNETIVRRLFKELFGLDMPLFPH